MRVSQWRTEDLRILAVAGTPNIDSTISGLPNRVSSEFHAARRKSGTCDGFENPVQWLHEFKSMTIDIAISHNRARGLSGPRKSNLQFDFLPLT
jgi:hypothetical protein